MKQRPGPHAIVHFADGIVAIVGETTPRQVTLAILGGGNPGGSLRVKGTPEEMARLFAAGGKVALAVSRGGKR